MLWLKRERDQKHQRLAIWCSGFIANFKQRQVQCSVRSVHVFVRIDSFRFQADGMEHAHTNGG